jgi:hypothetical protein
MGVALNPIFAVRPSLQITHRNQKTFAHLSPSNKPRLLQNGVKKTYGWRGMQIKMTFLGFALTFILLNTVFPYVYRYIPYKTVFRVYGVIGTQI